MVVGFASPIEQPISKSACRQCLSAGVARIYPKMLCLSEKPSCTFWYESPGTPFPVAPIPKSLPNRNVTIKLQDTQFQALTDRAPGRTPSGGGSILQLIDKLLRVAAPFGKLFWIGMPRAARPAFKSAKGILERLASPRMVVSVDHVTSEGFIGGAIEGSSEGLSGVLLSSGFFGIAGRCIGDQLSIFGIRLSKRSFCFAHTRLPFTG